MTSQNEQAEEVMKRIEKEEERAGYEDPHKRCYHLCIVNLVIGTLYCAKGNYEFGISRICKSLDPFNRKVSSVLLNFFVLVYRVPLAQVSFMNLVGYRHMALCQATFLCTS